MRPFPGLMFRRLTSTALAIPLLAALLALAACAAPSPSTGAASSAAIQQEAPAQIAVPAPEPPRTKPAPEMSKPLPPQQMPAPVALDYACRSSSDCAVKNVGNCCGEMPQCVNKDSPTDPDGVQAACARSGRMGICGFQPIDRCECVQGRCEGRVMEVNGNQVPQDSSR